MSILNSSQQIAIRKIRTINGSLSNPYKKKKKSFSKLSGYVRPKTPYECKLTEIISISVGIQTDHLRPKLPRRKFPSLYCSFNSIKNFIRVQRESNKIAIDNLKFQSEFYRQQVICHKRLNRLLRNYNKQFSQNYELIKQFQAPARKVTFYQKRSSAISKCHNNMLKFKLQPDLYRKDRPLSAPTINSNQSHNVYSSRSFPTPRCITTASPTVVKPKTIFQQPIHDRIEKWLSSSSDDVVEQPIVKQRVRNKRMRRKSRVNIMENISNRSLGKSMTSVSPRPIHSTDSFRSLRYQLDNYKRNLPVAVRSIGVGTSARYSEKRDNILIDNDSDFDRKSKWYFLFCC